MKAAYIEKPGPPENIVFGQLPKPKPVGSQVLVKVKAVAVNPVDTYIRSGTYQFDLPKPFIVGCDLAGVVEAVGPD
ncbi:MAG TPA: alcohol dehydrogenase catalytic domain-containing protein, partial [Thermoguttaceae bacterium]